MSPMPSTATTANANFISPCAHPLPPLPSLHTRTSRHLNTSAWVGTWACSFYVGRSIGLGCFEMMQRYGRRFLGSFWGGIFAGASPRSRSPGWGVVTQRVVSCGLCVAALLW